MGAQAPEKVAGARSLRLVGVLGVPLSASPALSQVSVLSVAAAAWAASCVSAPDLILPERPSTKSISSVPSLVLTDT